VLAAIQRLFASDEAALKVITGLMSGMAAEEIRCHCDVTAVEYDTTRPRITRETKQPRQFAVTNALRVAS